MKKTITIQIGNSDNKLTQSSWACFCGEVDAVLRNEWASGLETHFHGFSASNSPFQNACWVVAIDLHQFGPLQAKLNSLREEYKQESIAWTEGCTHFIK